MTTMHAPDAATDALTAVITETRLGWAGVALSSKGIRYATLFHRTRAGVAGELRAQGATEGEDERSSEVADLLRRYAAGDEASLDDYPVDLPACTEFQRETWLALREIPRGETRSYGWLARHVGREAAPRAIGAMVGANPIPLWLPCHRVVASDGSLHGFGGGLAMKQALLELEGALPKRLV
jgi:methylated-DNA-[protein]-cysteine S-methyltransferase